MTVEQALRYQAEHCQHVLMQVAQGLDPRTGLMLALMALYR